MPSSRKVSSSGFIFNSCVWLSGTLEFWGARNVPWGGELLYRDNGVH